MRTRAPRKGNVYVPLRRGFFVRYGPLSLAFFHLFSFATSSTMAGMPSESELEIALREILRVVNVEEASLKIIRQKLEARFEVCVFPKLSADRVLAQ